MMDKPGKDLKQKKRRERMKGWIDILHKKLLEDNHWGRRAPACQSRAWVFPFTHPPPTGPEGAPAFTVTPCNKKLTRFRVDSACFYRSSLV